MSRRLLLVLYCCGLIVSTGAAILETSPGYMDADYYFAGAIRIASGEGSHEPYIWNFLNNPQQLPAPSFTYWMPLTSLVSAAGIWLLPRSAWWGARIPLLLLSGLISPLTALLSWRLTGKYQHARLAGLLALLPGYYLAYFPTTDAFVLEMVLGVLFLWLAAPGAGETLGMRDSLRRLNFQFLGVGVVVGLLHLARADGILWAASGLLAAWLAFRKIPFGKAYHLLGLCGALFVGYAMVTAGWYARNLGEWGSLFPPGGAHGLWISEYEQTMIFPASLLTPQHWLDSGWRAHLQARINALSAIFQTMLAVQGEIVLFPFILAGLWRLRRREEVKIGVAVWGVFVLLMIILFPFASTNGSYFHSSSALQPLLWAVVPAGIETLVNKYITWRRINSPKPMQNFLTVLILITCFLFTGFIYFRRVVGSEPGNPRWNASSQHYRLVESALAASGAQPGSPVLVNNPPGFWLAAGRPAVVIPYGGPEMMLAAARRFHVEYVILEQANPWQLGDLYFDRVSIPELEYISSVGATRLYRILPLNQ